ncbi:DEAD/DEAH box helicase family protein [Crateriforma conspicua]|uniref:Type-1 restriction enzyme R protein n=1 Tax=Crateriforma conspicua TaxID=2527996 RepID=A0A5C5YB68_9PLAN|nr:DEAD/DEAH box helicase family protein [Crateriforma conspicua]TWT71651.1 Type-1 restriction enzyme R protein [Crateriforma conspicua]
MASNFDFLSGGWPALHEDAVACEGNVFTAPRTTAFYARRTLEKMTKWLYAHDSYLNMPYQDNLAALIHEPTFKDTLAPGLFPHVKLIHKLGNLAVHSDTPINSQDALNVTRCLHHVVGWMAKSYSKPPITPAKFDDSLIPRPADASIADRTAEQLETLQKSLESKDKAFDEAQAKLAGTEEELARLKAEIQAIKAANAKTIGDDDYSEAQTRDLFIDLMLREAGWDPKGVNVEEYEVAGMPNKQGVGYVDYVLWGDDGLPLGVVEAKKTKVNSTIGGRQAELYADCLEKKFGQRPIVYYSNGYETWLWDDTRYPPREVQGFASKDELQLMINRRSDRKDITKIAPSKTIVERYYHREAIARIMESYGEANTREALVVMATGTGKTRLSIATVELLMKAGWVKRVLFLADRTALLRQAKRAFNKHLPHATLVNLVEEKSDENARVVFSTYPTIMNLIDDTKNDGQRRYGVNHFDLIIIDEAHRSVYQKYRAIFEYFDSLLLGLTATPRDEVDRDTYGLFGLESGNPTFAYELDQAISDGFLVGFKAISVPLKFQRDGVKYDELSDDEKLEYEEKFYDDETGSLPAAIESPAVNKWLFNQDTVDRVLKKLMTDGLKVGGGDRIGKTLIFAKNHDHAEFIVERFNKNFPKTAGKTARVIDNHVKYAHTLIDDFYIADKAPLVAVSVDMMDTGIDVPEIVNLVFFKIVRSKTKFWQMIGRGTRLCADLFGPGKDKTEFYIFDYCQNLEFFGQRPDGYDAPLQDSIKTKIFRRRLQVAHQLPASVPNADHAADATLRIGSESEWRELPEAFHTSSEKELGQLTELRHDLVDQMHEVVTKLDTDNFIVRPKRRYVEKFSNRENLSKLSPEDVLDLDQNIAPLPYEDDDEEMARRFDLLMLSMQLAILETSPRQARYQRQVISLMGNLEEKQAIPAVAKELELILELQRDETWQNITLPMLELARKKLRDLIKFIDRTGSEETVYTNFMDDEGDEVEITGLVQADPGLANYRLRVERFIREHETHPTIARIKNNLPLHAGDIDSLEAILFADDGPGTRDEFIETYGSDEPLGVLVRRIVGLDRTAAKSALADFLAEGQYTADQIRFVDLVIDHLVDNGLIDLAQLFEPPFTDIHAEGVAGVMGKNAETFIGAVRQINANATGVAQ